MSNSKNKPYKPVSIDQQAEGHVESTSVFFPQCIPGLAPINSHHNGGGDGREGDKPAGTEQAFLIG